MSFFHDTDESSTLIPDCACACLSCSRLSTVFFFPNVFVLLYQGSAASPNPTVVLVLQPSFFPPRHKLAELFIEPLLPPPPRQQYILVMNIARRRAFCKVVSNARAGSLNTNTPRDQDQEGWSPGRDSERRQQPRVNNNVQLFRD